MTSSINGHEMVNKSKSVLANINMTPGGAMKKLVLFILLALTFSVSAFAKDGYATRYTVRYSTWDSGFNSYYAYSEVPTYSSCRYHTCYDYRYDDNIYVEETIITGGSYNGYTRVTVYDTAGYHNTGRYVTYYTHNGRIVRRNYHRNHRHIHGHYHYDSYYSSVNYIYLDQFTAELILATNFVSIGADVLSRCDSDDSLCIAIGLASSISGSAISISASIRENKRTELQRYMERKTKLSNDQDLADSLDLD
jgi:hypothetical protein